MSTENHIAENTPEKEAIGLSELEWEIIRLIQKGYISKEIAQLRNCSSRTIEKHRSNIIRKLGIDSSQHALLIWIMKHPQYFNT